jgi:membrane dipeptidase
MQKIIDLHCDTIGQIQAGIDIVIAQADGHIDIPRLQMGNVGCQIFACFISSMVPEDSAFDEAITLLKLVEESCDRYKDYFQKVEDAAQIQSVLNNNKIAVLPAVENGYALSNDLNKLESLRRYGSRYMTLTHMKNLHWAASSGESACDFEGLTEFGKKVIHAMNEMGMIIDVSHVHESTFWAALNLTRRPLIASHSNASTLCPAARNLTDDQIKGIADNGGMIGINFYPGFLDSAYLEGNIERCSDLFVVFDTIEEKYWQQPEKRLTAYHELGKEFRKRMSNIQIGYRVIIDHISHIIELVGDDFVGFGSDFDGLPALPEGMGGCDIFPSIISLLEEKGYSENTIKKISQDNFLRVLAENDR